MQMNPRMLAIMLEKYEGLTPEEARAKAGLTDQDDNAPPTETPGTMPRRPLGFTGPLQLEKPNADASQAYDDNSFRQPEYRAQLEDPNRKIFTSDGAHNAGAKVATDPNVGTEQDNVYNWLKNKQQNDGGADQRAEALRLTDRGSVRGLHFPTAVDTAIGEKAVADEGKGDIPANRKRAEMMEYLYKKQGNDAKASELALDREKFTTEEGRKKAEAEARLAETKTHDAMSRERLDEEKRHNKQAEGAAWAAAGARDDKQDDTDTQKVAKETGGDPARILSTLTALRTRIAGKKDIPGIGTIEGRIPDALTGDEGLKNRNDAKAIADALLRMQSGAGVSDKERQSTYRLYGIEGGDERAFTDGLDRLESAIQAEVKAKQAGFKPKVVEKYKERGGTTPEDFNKKAAKVEVTNGKETFLIDPKDLADAEKDGFKPVKKK